MNEKDLTKKYNILDVNFQNIINENFVEWSLTSKKFTKEKETGLLKSSYDSRELCKLVNIDKKNLLYKISGGSFKDFIIGNKEDKKEIFDVNLQELQIFLTKFEREILKEVTSYFNEQFESLKKNTYQSSLNYIENWKMNRETVLQNSIDQKELIIKAGMCELEKISFENDILKKEKMYLNDKLQFRIQKNSISSSQTLIQKNDFSENENQENENFDEAKGDLEVKIFYLENSLRLLKMEKNEWTEFYQIWENKKESYEERRKEQELSFNIINDENFKLKIESQSLKSLLNKRNNEIEKLEINIKEKEDLLNFSVKNLSNLKKDKSSLRIKLLSLLALDSSRNFLPNSVGNYITRTQTLIFATEINSNSSANRIVWNSVSIFLVFSIVLGVKKIIFFLSYLKSSFFNFCRKIFKVSTNKKNDKETFLKV